MIIDKILGISNLGKIIDWKADGKVWNGQLNKTTAIYADNGSGKTTFTQIFKSLKSDDLELFVKRLAKSEHVQSIRTVKSVS